MNLTQLQSAQSAAKNSLLDGNTRWYSGKIDGTRWNKQFPYQLAIYKVSNDGGLSVESTFTLPIPPESMSITMPFASVVTATMGGIVEENNDAPFRLISFTGTTGVVPLKGTAKQAQLSSFNGIFAGTLNAVSSTVDSSQAVLSGKPAATSNLIDLSPPEDILKTTGYYQFRLLQRFLEGYAAIKKKGEGRNYRLAVCIWKDEAVYFVTPQTFAVQRNAMSPYEYSYSLQFKAWKRVDGVAGPATGAGIISVVQPNWLQEVKNRINYVRDAIQGGTDVLRAVRSDLDDAVWGTVRQVSLVVDDALGLATSVSSFPSSIIADCKNSIAKAAALKDKAAYLERTYGELWDGVKEWLYGDSADPSVLGGVNGNNAGGGGVGIPDGKNAVFNAFTEQEIEKTPTLSQKIEDEKSAVRAKTADDYAQMKADLAVDAADFAYAVNASGTTFESTYGIKASARIKDAPTDADFEILFALNELSGILDRLIVANTSQQTSTASAVEYIGGLATQAGIAFTQPVSKIGVPFPYGSSLEAIAMRYLGDANRWHEIAALNGLQSPYVDETGFDLPLLVNGDTNTIVVDYVEYQKLFIGQVVWIGSNTVNRTKRRITALERVENALYVTVDGSADLDKYDTADNAVLHAYLPYTINSQQMLYIPSEESVEEGVFRTDKIPSVDETDKMLRVGGIDLLLTSDSDLVVTPTGDGQWAVGLTGIVQWLRTVMSIPAGSLLQHPNVGLDLKVGQSITDTSASAIAASVKQLMALNPAFTDLNSVSVDMNGPVTSIASSVGIKGVSDNVPLVMTVKN